MAEARLNFHGSGWRSAWRVASVDARSAELVLDDSGVDDVYRYDAIQRFRLESGRDRGRDRARQSRRRSHALYVRAASLVSGPCRRACLFHCVVPLALRRGRPGRDHGPIPLDADYETPRAVPSGYRNVCYAGWDGRAEIAWPDDGVAISMVADPVFGHLMLHAPADGEPVFCLEPQTAPPCAFDELESGPAAGVHVLQPGDRVSGNIRFVIRNRMSPPAESPGSAATGTPSL